MKVFSLFILGPLLFLAGCTALIHWNPVVNGLELDEKVSFNYADIGIEIKSLAFWNAQWNPRVRLEVVNFTPDTVRFSPGEFKICIGPDTLAPKKGASAPVYKMPPDWRAKLELDYEYTFRESRLLRVGDRELDVPQPTSLHFAFPAFHWKDTTITVPPIEYVAPYRKSLGTQFVLRDGHIVSAGTL